MKLKKNPWIVVALIFVSLLMITCGSSEPELPPPTDSPDLPQPTEATSEPEDEEPALIVALKENPLEIGDVDSIDNGYVRAWLYFPGTIENTGNTILADLHVCVYLEYEIAYDIAGDCDDDLPDLAVGDTTDYGVGFFAEAPPEAIQAASYEITVRSGENTVSIIAADE